MLSKYVLSWFIFSFFRILVLFLTSADHYHEAQNVLYPYALALRPCRVRAESILNLNIISTMLLVCGDVGEELDILERLFLDFNGYRRRGNDVWSEIANVPPCSGISPVKHQRRLKVYIRLYCLGSSNQETPDCNE